MIMKIINASIDLTKIDKSKIKNHQNGGKYYQISIIVKDEKDQFGNDVAIQQSQTKEEREAQTPKIYLGNGKTAYDSGGGQPVSNTPATDNEPDDLPF